LSFIVLVIPTPQAEESCSHGSWAHTISTPLKSRARVPINIWEPPETNAILSAL
jgi:hypothetical protein